MKFTIDEICEQLYKEHGKNFTYKEGVFQERVVDKVGNIYRRGGDLFLLKNANRWIDGIKVKNVYNISPEEMKRTIGCMEISELEFVCSSVDVEKILKENFLCV